MGRKLLRPIFQPKSRGARGRFHLKGPFAGPVGGGGYGNVVSKRKPKENPPPPPPPSGGQGAAEKRRPLVGGPDLDGVGTRGTRALEERRCHVGASTYLDRCARAQREEGTLSSTAGSCCASGQGWRRRRILSCDGAGGGDLLGRAGPHGWQQHWLSAHGLPCLSSESLEEEEEEEEDRPTCSRRRRRRSIGQHQREARCQPAAL